MLNSPLTLTIDGVAHTLSRINQDNFGSTFLKKATGLELRLSIRNSYEGKPGQNQIERHNVDLVKTTWDSEGRATVYQTYVVMRAPRSSDAADVSNIAKALSAFLSTNALALAGWES